MNLRCESEFLESGKAVRCACEAEHEGYHANGPLAWWDEAAIPKLPAVPPAMQRALGEGEYNQIGEELRKIEAHLKTFAELCVGMEKSRQEDMARPTALQNNVATLNKLVCSLTESLAQLQQNQQLIMQKLGEIEESARRGAERGERVALSLDRISKRLLALELADRRARKRQPKPVRPSSKRKSTRKP